MNPSIIELHKVRILAIISSLNVKISLMNKFILIIHLLKLNFILFPCSMYTPLSSLYFLLAWLHISLLTLLSLLKWSGTPEMTRNDIVEMLTKIKLIFFLIIKDDINMKYSCSSRLSIIKKILL